MGKEYCDAHHDDKMCFLPIRRYFLIVTRDVKDLLQKLDAFCFNSKHGGGLYTLFKYRVFGKIVVKSGKLFDNMQRPVHFNHQNKGVDRLPNIAKLTLTRKKYKQHLLSSFQKTKSTKSSGSVYADRIGQVEMTKFELELIKTVA